MSEQAIVLNELTKHYGKHRGINNLSFSVNQGEFFGFIGPNGAGKSTTIRTLMGLIRPTGGSASIFDLDCHSKASVIARDVGYLPSENSYYENMKVRELLQYTADLYGMDCKTKMKELADRLNLDLSRKIADLSLGNKKKVGREDFLQDKGREEAFQRIEAFPSESVIKGMVKIRRDKFGDVKGIPQEHEKGRGIFLKHFLTV